MRAERINAEQDVPMSERLVALLPMKAHSDRVPGKNFRMFHGKPLFRWVLDTLLSVPDVAEVVINTDAREILREQGLVDGDRVTIRDRKPEISGDFVSINLIIADDVVNVPANTYLMTHTTNPLLGRDTIQRAVDAFRTARAEGCADSLFTVNRFQGRFYWDDLTPVNHQPDQLIRTQDLDPLFEENSNLYVFTRKSFQATGARIGRKPIVFETPRLESVDIDDETGWRLAEALAETAAQG